MSEKLFGIKETVQYKFDDSSFVPGDVYLIKTRSMSEPRFAIHEYTSENYVQFLLPNNQAMETARYRTCISVDELVEGSATIKPVLSYSEYMKSMNSNKKCGDCANYERCNYPGCPITVDTPACSDYVDRRSALMECGECVYFAQCCAKYDDRIGRNTTACSAFSAR